ncbi:MAG: hypothetical protein GWO19_10015 [Nitrospinaceae bacterium]|nr:hypothetical protein [Nitrospinaceae bacterium]
MHQEPPRVKEILGWVEKARLFALDVWQAVRFLLEQGLVSAYGEAKKEIKFVFKRFTVLDYVFGNLSLLVLFLGLLVVAAGFGVLGYQIGVWLLDGVWNELPLMVIFNYLFENTALWQWVQNPESWLGFHKLVEWNLNNVPVSLVLIFNGLVISGGMSAVILMAVMIRRFQFKHRDPA